MVHGVLQGVYKGEFLWVCVCCGSSIPSSTPPHVSAGSTDVPRSPLSSSTRTCFAALDRPSRGRIISPLCHEGGEGLEGGLMGELVGELRVG